MISPDNIACSTSISFGDSVFDILDHTRFMVPFSDNWSCLGRNRQKSLWFGFPFVAENSLELKSAKLPKMALG